MSAKKQSPDGMPEDESDLEKSSGESDLEKVSGGEPKAALPQPDAHRKPDAQPKPEPKPALEPKPVVKPKPAAESKTASREKEGEAKTLAEIMKFDLKIRRPRR